MRTTKQSSTKTTKPGVLHIFWSLVAAFCGVQNSSNHDRDDAYIDEVGFKPYIIAGIVLTLIFIAALLVIVKLILG